MISADREAMEHMGPQKPYSDAYASAMPMKKRKVWGRGKSVAIGSGGRCATIRIRSCYVYTTQMENGKAEVSSLTELLTSSVEKAVQQTRATPTSGAPLDGM